MVGDWYGIQPLCFYEINRFYLSIDCGEEDDAWFDEKSHDVFRENFV